MLNIQTTKRNKVIAIVKEMIKKKDMNMNDLRLWIAQTHQVSMRTSLEYIRMAGG